MNLSNIPTHELLEELNNRKESTIKNAVEAINRNIRIINQFGITVEHESDSIELLPEFKIERFENNQISVVTYKERICKQ